MKNKTSINNYIRCTYICPIRTTKADEVAINEFFLYWEFLKNMGCEVLVVDGSPPEIFNRHSREWTNCTHIKVDPQFTFLNGKVNGIMTAVPAARHEKIILADDDIHYTRADIERMIQSLDLYEVVRPQNYFKPLPLWAKLDAGRILLNRAFFPTGDFPGTFGFKKNIFLKAGSFDGDVLFDNEELLRHLHNFGAHINYANDFFVLRKPPSLSKWIEQRPRQAYEDFVMKKRTALSLAVIPIHLILFLTGRRRTANLLAIGLAAFATFKAMQGRDNSAKAYFPISTVIFAPLWVLERAISVYLAVYWKFTKGGYPFGDKLISKGTGKAWKHLPEQDFILSRHKNNLTKARIEVAE